MTRPNLLVIAGHDPSGGAGIQADIESAAANGAHAVTVTTLLTCQDTSNVHAVQPVDTAFFQRCLDTVLDDMSFGAIKLGVIASIEQVAIIAALARSRPGTPLVVDPVLQAAGGGSLAGDAVGLALRDQLFPLAEVITPNAVEARLLCEGESSLDVCGARLAELGCGVLVTGADEHGDDVVNRWFESDEAPSLDRWPRLPGVYHGSGCTLASAIAAQLANEVPCHAAIQAAQAYTWHTLEHGLAAGRGQRIPNRLGVTMS